MLEWLERAQSDRVFLDDGSRRVTYGEAAEVVATAQPESLILRPALTIDDVLEVLAVATSGTAVLLGPGRPPMDHGDSGPGFIVHTSGTTAQPKPVSLSWGNWTAAAESSMAHLGHGSGDTWLLAMPVHHVAGLGIVLRSAFAGGTVRVLPAFHAEAYAGALHEVTMASVVPRMLSRALDAHPGPYHGLRAVLVGGGPIPHELLLRAKSAGLPVLPTYGLTETCGQVATLKPNAPLEKKAHPLPGVEIEIREGQIALRGAMVSEAVTDANGWFLTGDSGQLDDEGALVVTGRVDDLIITGGENVSPEAVEEALLGVNSVDEVVVVGLPSDEWGMEVAAIYTGLARPDDLAQVVLPSHARPKRVLKVETIPRTALGKPDRSAVAALFEPPAHS